MLGHKKLHKSDPVIQMSFQFHVSDKKYNLGSEFLKEDAEIEPQTKISNGQARPEILIS